MHTFPGAWDLRYFQEIALAGNLSRAAERLGVGQPALSVALKRLERDLGTPLFFRRHRGLDLTAAGQRLLREANALLLSWEAIVSQTQRSETELVGRFSLGCHPSVAVYALKDAVRELYLEYPGVELQLRHGLSRTIGEGVISGTLDFGIVVNPVRHPDLVIHELAQDEVTFWRASHGLRSELEDVLIYNPALAQSQALLKRLKKSVAFRRTLESDNLEVILSLARSGAGTAILPSRVAQAAGSQLSRCLGFPSYKDAITFIHRADLPKTASTRAVIGLFKRLQI